MFSKFFQKFAKSPPILGVRGFEGLRKGTSEKSPAFAAAKGGENMNEPIRTQWQIRCAFNGFCKQALKREAMNAHRDTKRQQSREVLFRPVTAGRKPALYLRQYFADDEAEQSFIIAERDNCKAACRSPAELAGRKARNYPAVLFL